MEKENVNLMAIDKKLIDQLLAERSERSEAVRKEKTDVGPYGRTPVPDWQTAPQRLCRNLGAWRSSAYSQCSQ
jgi:hypothetical protein